MCARRDRSYHSLADSTHSFSLIIMASEQPRSKSINFPIAKGDIVPISTEDIDYMYKIVENFHFSHLSDEMESRDILAHMVKETRWTSARAVYLEVQNYYWGNDDKVHYAYTGGTAFAIGPHHLLTAFHLLQPDDDFVKHLKEGTGCYSKILELDPLFELQENERPEETARWNAEGEYEILHVVPHLDVALLHTKKTHLVTPLYLEPLYGGISRVFTLDLSNYFSQQVHRGRCWAAEESSGEYYFFDSLAEKGFSGGPILGISFIIFVPTLSDRYAAAVGIVLSDAGKQRVISRFVSLGAVFDALSKKDPALAENLKYVKSKYIYGPSAWNVPLEVESGSSMSPIIEESYVASTPASTTPSFDPSSHTFSPQTFKTGIFSRMDPVLSRVRQYQKFVGDWEGGYESGSGESEQTVPESAGMGGPPRVRNWRMKVGVSKVEGRRVVL